MNVYDVGNQQHGPVVVLTDAALRRFPATPQKVKQGPLIIRFLSQAIAKHSLFVRWTRLGGFGYLSVSVSAPSRRRRE